MCSKTNKQVEASRSLYLDELPSVLILHLKRFIYDETSSAGCQKLLKNIDFPVDLEIPRDILSNNSKNKYHTKQRSYKLFAVSINCISPNFVVFGENFKLLQTIVKGVSF
jgi:ubiquitin carboxyl-terminal hydrolase 10